MCFPKECRENSVECPAYLHKLSLGTEMEAILPQVGEVSIISGVRGIQVTHANEMGRKINSC